MTVIIGGVWGMLHECIALKASGIRGIYFGVTSRSCRDILKIILRHRGMDLANRDYCCCSNTNENRNISPSNYQNKFWFARACALPGLLNRTKKFTDLFASLW